MAFSLVFSIAFLAGGEGQVDQQIPAMPLMTLYQFDGDPGIPFYSRQGFLKKGPKRPAGRLAQGSLVIPCVAFDGKKPVTISSGTPYVGFEVVYEPSAEGAPVDTEALKLKAQARKTLRVENHHCGEDVAYVIDARRLIHRATPPYMLPPHEVPGSAKDQALSQETANDVGSIVAQLKGDILLPAQHLDQVHEHRTGLQGTKPGTSHGGWGAPVSERDAVVRAFHSSTTCQKYTAPVMGRRGALAKAWTEFAKSEAAQKWSQKTVKEARHLDYVIRTALYEGHLGRGCSAYGACERNVIALSIRNRAKGQCLSRQGCAFEGDYEGVASMVSQYNIWDEYLTQISGLATCFMRSDLQGLQKVRRLQAMYQQNVADIETILYGDEDAVAGLFSGASRKSLFKLRHYYHPPAMGKCFPKHDKVEYISAALAQKGQDYALLINTRILVGGLKKNGYHFQDFVLEEGDAGDSIAIEDLYPGYQVDRRKVSLQKPRGCTAYGVSRGCKFGTVGRYRKPAYWLKDGEALALQCTIMSRGKSCAEAPKSQTIDVGGPCDTDMQPVSGVW